MAAAHCTMSREAQVPLDDLPRPFMRSLVKEHLYAKDKLHLFQANADMAKAVLQDVDIIQLVLNGHDGEDNMCYAEEFTAQHHSAMPWGSSSSSNGSYVFAATGCSCGGSKQQTQGRALQALLAVNKCSLQVELWGQLSGRWQFLPKANITCLTLTGITLTADLLDNQLQLQHCHRLHTLVLKGQCRSQLTAGEIASWSAQRRAALIPSSLTHLKLRDDSSDYACFEAWAQLLSAQVSHLTLHTRGFQLIPDCLLATHLELPNGLTEGIMDSLLTAPHITHITASDCHLFKDHSSQHVQWQLLKLTSNHWGPDLSRLLHLPLQHIQELVIHHLHCDSCCGSNSSHIGMLSSNQAIARLTASTKLLCVPKQAQRPGLQDPTFMLRGKFSSELITLCASSLTGDGCLVLDVSPAGTHILPGISQLPDSLRKLCLGSYVARSHLSAEEQADEQQFWQQLASALPKHINELVLDLSAHRCFSQCGGRYLAALLPAMAAAGRLGTLCMLPPTCMAAAPMEVQHLLQTYPVRLLKAKT